MHTIAAHPGVSGGPLNRTAYNQPCSVTRLAGKWLQAHDAGDPAALGAVLHPDVEVHSLFRTEPVRGREAALSHFRGTMTAFPDLEIAVLASAADGPAATFLAEVDFTGHFSGTWARTGAVVQGTGRAFRVRGAVLLTLADDRVRAVRTLFDRDDWLRQCEGG